MTHHHPTNSTTNNQHAMYFNCNFCGGKIEGEEAWIGLESECPYCNKKITVPAPEAIQLPPGPPPKGGDLAKTGPSATIDGGQGVNRNSQGTETNRSRLPTEGVAGWLDHLRMDWTEDLAARIGRLPKMLVWSSVVGVVVLLAFCIVHGLRETKRRSISHNNNAYSPWRSSYSYGSPKRSDRQKATQGAYDLYMKGYNDPEQAEIAEAVIGGGSSDGERKCLMLIKLGAEDRRNGMSVRFELVR